MFNKTFRKGNNDISRNTTVEHRYNQMIMPAVL